MPGPAPTTSPDGPAPQRAGRLAAWALAMAFVLMIGPLLVMSAGGATGTSEEADEREYHLPVIQRFADDWPHVDLVTYDSATAPGYHLLMAGILKAAPVSGKTLMHLANALFGLGLVLATFLTARRFAPPWPAALLCLPMAFNTYVVGATVWLTTDNAALLAAALVWGGALLPMTFARGVRLGVWSALSVGVRQVHAWTAGVLILAGLLASPLSKLAPRLWREDDTLPAKPLGWGPLAGALVGVLFPAALLASFIWLWGGLLPRIATGWVILHNNGPNPAAPAFGLALTGVLGLAFVPVAWRHVLRLRLLDRAVLNTLAITLALALIPETSYVWKTRSYGWLWRIIEKLPDVRERSVVIALMAPVGGLVLLVLYRAACAAGRRVPALILLTGLLGWLCAQMVNSMAWQRYFEPVLLLALAWLTALGIPNGPRPGRLGTVLGHEPISWHDGTGPALRALLWRVLPWAGVIALALGQAGLVGITTYREVLSGLLSR